MCHLVKDCNHQRQKNKKIIKSTCDQQSDVHFDPSVCDLGKETLYVPSDYRILKSYLALLL